MLSLYILRKPVLNICSALCDYYTIHHIDKVKADKVFLFCHNYMDSDLKYPNKMQGKFRKKNLFQLSWRGLQNLSLRIGI